MEFAVTFGNPKTFISELALKSKSGWIMDFSNQTRRPMTSKEIKRITVLPENTFIDINHPDKVKLFNSFKLKLEDGIDDESDAEAEVEELNSKEPEGIEELEIEAEAKKPVVEEAKPTVEESAIEESTKEEAESKPEEVEEAEEDRYENDDIFDVIRNFKKIFERKQSQIKKLEQIKSIIKESDVTLHTASKEVDDEITKLSKKIDKSKEIILSIIK
jgi:hypothetical protein